MPHAIPVDDVAARVLGDLEHAAVHVRGHAGDHVLGHTAQAVDGPVLLHEVGVAADAAGGHHHGLRAEFELADGCAGRLHAARFGRRLEHRAAHPHGGAVLDDQIVHLVPVAKGDLSAGGGVEHRFAEHPDHFRSRAPRDVEARYRISVTGGQPTAAFGPADVRHHAQAEIVQVGPLLAGREVDVGLGPLPGPTVFAVAVESGAAQPVLQRQFTGVLDAHAALLGAVHQEQAAE